MEKDVMAFEMVSRSQWHYTFTFEIDLVVPTGTRLRNFLKHPFCDASEVERLAKDGWTVAEISRELKVANAIVRRVIIALGLKPLAKRPVSYLNHPLCPALEVLRLMKEGKNQFEIGRTIGVSKVLVGKVLRAVAASTPETIRSLPKRKRICKARGHSQNYRVCDAADFLRLRAAGGSYEQIACELHVSLPAVREAAKAIRTSAPELLEALPKRKRVVTKPPVDYLKHPLFSADKAIRLRAEGQMLREIAAELGVSVSTMKLFFKAVRSR